MSDDTGIDAELNVALNAVKNVVANITTLLVFVLDQSGSMSPLKTTTIDGFNDFIDEQKNQPGKAFVSLTLFDTTPEDCHVGVPLADYPRMTTQDYRPSGGTALYDAIGLSVEKAEKWIAQQPKAPSKVLFTIITDGDENSSTDFDAGSIKKLIEKKQEQEWDFSYLGANQDAILTAQRMNIPQKMSANFAANKGGMKSALRGVSAAVSTYRSSPGKSAGLYDTDDI